MYTRQYICRNASLALAGVKMPTPVKTGTTIAGLVFKVGTIEPLETVFHTSTNTGWSYSWCRYTSYGGKHSCALVISSAHLHIFVITQGSVVADKNCAKIHYMAKNI